MHRPLVTALLFTTTLWGAPAWAQDAVTSEALFRKGVDDMTAGRFETACPAISESLRLDPRPGTLFALAECYAKAGKPANAVVRYDEYLTAFSRMTPEQQSKQLGREKTAKEQRNLLARDVPMLVVKLDPSAPPDTIVKRDDTVLNSPSLGLPLPVDPGEHTITAQAPNGAPTTQKIVIERGDRVEISLRVESPPVAMREAPSASALERKAPNAPVAPGASGRGDTQRIVAYVLGGVGAGGIVAGAIAGGLTLAKKSSVEESCSFESHRCDSQQGLDDLSAARMVGVVSTVGLVVGGALLATGTIVFLTAPTSPSTHASMAVTAGPSSAFLSITGAFQ